MKNISKVFIVFLLLGVSLYLSQVNQDPKNTEFVSEEVERSLDSSEEIKIEDSLAENELVDPIEDYKNKILYKSYGLYVTPSSSPVQPERFEGYHTGVDIEVESEDDTSVYAVADGNIELRENANGYGGVMIVTHEIDEQIYSFLYGHLDSDSFIESDTVKKGDQIAVLGEAFSEETDGERKHLHLSVKPGFDLDLRRYVETEDELLEWIDPLDLLEDKEVSLANFSERDFRGYDLKLENVLSENDIYTRHEISYKSGALNISGIMNVPKGEGPFPVLILNHGYIDPDIYTLGRGLKREQDYFAKEGYVVIHPDYRNHAFSSKVGNNGINFRFGYTEDVVNLVKAVEKSDLGFMDKDRIGMMGHSMGGGITSNIIVSLPDLVDAAVLYAPVSADYRDNFDKWTRGDRMGDLLIEKYGDFDDNPEFWDGISPINYLKNLEVPVLLQQGTADASTPKEWADKLSQKAEEEGVALEYQVYNGGRHEFVRYWNQFMEKNLEFFEKNLK